MAPEEAWQARRREDVVSFFLNEHNFIHEKRLQKLIFLADLHSLQTTGKRLLDADFKPYYHGVFSDMISAGLQSMKGLLSQPDVAPDGRTTIVFLKPPKPYPTKTLGRAELNILRETFEAYKALTNEDLAELGKHSLLWDSAEFAQPFDYETYARDPAMRLTAEMAAAFENTEMAIERGTLKQYDSVEAMWAAMG